MPFAKLTKADILGQVAELAQHAEEAGLFESLDLQLDDFSDAAARGIQAAHRAMAEMARSEDC